jgi:hypothetical protein
LQNFQSRPTNNAWVNRRVVPIHTWLRSNQCVSICLRNRGHLFESYKGVRFLRLWTLRCC